MIGSCGAETDDGEMGAGGMTSGGLGPGGDSSGAAGHSGVGGDAAGGSDQAGAGGVTPCGEYAPECCAAADRMPCKDLAEAECAALEFCSALTGVPWQRGEDANPGGAPAFAYVGCRSQCDDQGFAEAPHCVYDPREPAKCFVRLTEAAPDGWESVFECSEPPDEACTE